HRGDVVAGGVGDRVTGQLLQVRGHLRGRLVAVGGVLGHGGEHHGVDVDGGGGGEVGVDEGGGRGRRRPDVLVGHGEGGLAVAGRSAGDQLVEDAAEGVDVGAAVGGLAARLLRGEVLGGADDRRGLRHRRGGVVEGAG